MSEPSTPEIRALTDQLAAADVEQRAAAAERLAQAGPSAAGAAPQLVRACGDGDERVREWAVAALEDLGPPPRTAIDPLIKLATDPDPLAAYWAITLLGRSGQDASSAVTVLATCVESSSADLSVRQRAAWALGQIGPAAAAARAALERAAGQQDPRLARLATEALAAIGS
jgi:HEAT repeat protein